MERRIVIGDIHGCYLTLKKLLEKNIEITTKDNLYFVGDYVDRGPRSREVLDYIIHLKWQGYKTFPLRGNHEEMMINAFQSEEFMHAWYNNGAEETLKSFDVPEDIRFDYDGIRQIPDRYVHFLEGLPYFLSTDEYLIVHAGFNFNAEDIFEDKDAMIWIRDIKYDPEKAGQKAIIHGHTPMPLVNIEHELKKKDQYLINIDGGCVYKDLPGYGNLVAVDLNNRQIYSEKNCD